MKEFLARVRDVSLDVFLVTFGAAWVASGVALLASAANTLAGGVGLLETLALYLVATGGAAAAVAVLASTIRILAFDDGSAGRLDGDGGST